jgi:hypothetical protein
MTAMMLWLSANFELPAVHELPRVEFVSASKMVSHRYQVLSANSQNNLTVPDDALADTLAIYSDGTQTIYLREGWTGNSPAELSILVHEMVHHVQNVGRLKFACPQEREQLAYEAQERWLGLFRHDLQGDFGLDRMSIFVKSKCLY